MPKSVKTMASKIFQAVLTAALIGGWAIVSGHTTSLSSQGSDIAVLNEQIKSCDPTVAKANSIQLATLKEQVANCRDRATTNQQFMVHVVEKLDKISAEVHAVAIDVAGIHTH